MAHKVTILSTGYVTHDVKRYIVSKPENYTFQPGQATEVAIDKPGLRDDKRPFTFTSRPDDKILEFTIKSYHDHNGVTHALWDTKVGDTLLLDKPFGAIKYSKPGLFLAGGAGITPFLSIFRTLWSQGELRNSCLLYSNKTKADIICEHELTHYFSQESNGLLLTLTRKSAMGYVSGRITANVLKEFCPTQRDTAYICGPKEFVKNMREILESIGFEPHTLIWEK
ncbi:MAG: FAD-binding oxidoreductase [Candidatus Dojkabacteria bacterium]|nr:MAG: FAD-binding oxidoreductase [Candidatus Dojkabacteria bacterium]